MREVFEKNNEFVIERLRENKTAYIRRDLNSGTVNLESVTAKAYDKESLFSKTQDQGKDVYNVTTTTEKELTGATINKTGTVNTAVAGTYQVVYSVKDTAGNLGTKVLTVIVTE